LCAAARPHKSFVGRLSGDQRDIELPASAAEYLVAAFGVARLDRQRLIGFVHDPGKGVAVERETAAGVAVPQTDRGSLNALPSILRRRDARQQQGAYANDTRNVHVISFNIRATNATGIPMLEHWAEGNVGKFRMYEAWIAAESKPGRDDVVFDGNGNNKNIKNKNMTGEIMIASLRTMLLGLVCLTSLVAGMTPSSGRDYPNRPVRWLIGFAAGGRSISWRGS